MSVAVTAQRSLLMSAGKSRFRRVMSFLGQAFLFGVTSLSAVAVFFIFCFVVKDGVPFFASRGFWEFFTSARWYPAAEHPEFGALALFVGTAIVTVGAIVVAVPLGVAAAICLSDVLSFRIRQYVKPVIEILAAIPSVAYGFFALVVFAPLLQRNGGALLAFGLALALLPLLALAAIVLSDILADKVGGRYRSHIRVLFALTLASLGGALGVGLCRRAYGLDIGSGTNILNVSIILGIMALPTIVSVSEDALQAVGRELREGSYALGATRAETIVKTVIPAAISGILAAVILGLMRVIGETMVVWMASGNAAAIPSPIYDLLDPARTITATIAGEMGEADQITGSARYHVLFALAICLLGISFVMNVVSQWIIARQRKKIGK